jgi:hypothetical protein
MAQARSRAGGNRFGLAEAPSHARGNRFGLAEAAGGLIAGFLLSFIAVSIYVQSSGHNASVTSYGADIVSLLGLWAGFVGAMVAATRIGARLYSPPAGRAAAPAGARLAENAGTGSLVEDYGIRIKPLVDLPVGIAIGVASQFLLIPAMEAPLRPFVSHLDQRLGHPANQLLGHVNGAGLVALALLICLGSPIVEELFFRGLLLRALIGRLAPLGPRIAPAVSIVLSGIVFGLVHFEALQFLGLAGFGIVLGVLAWWTGRLGPSIVAHMAFNATTVVAYVLTH